MANEFVTTASTETEEYERPFISSPTISKLATALAKAQTKFAAVKRTAENPFFKSHYAPLEEVIAATRPALNDEGIAVTQLTQVMGDGKTVLLTMLIHNSGEYIGGTYGINPVKTDPQGFGSAISYARRYSRSACLDVASESDDDGNTSSITDAHKQTKLPQPSKMQPPATKTEPMQTAEAVDEPKPADKPDDEVLNGCETKIGTVEKYVLKEGATKKGTWQRHAILLDKEWYSTFSATVGAAMKAMEKKEAMIYYKVQPSIDGKTGNNQLIWIEAAE